MKKILVVFLLAGNMYANKCFILVEHYNLFSENEKRVYLAGLQDRFDYEIREGKYQFSIEHLKYLNTHNIDDIRRVIDYFLQKNIAFQDNLIEIYCMSDIFGLVISAMLKNKFKK